MDRAAKTKKYRKKVRRQQQSSGHYWYIGLVVLLLFGTVFAVWGTKTFQKQEEGLSAITCAELKAMLSFLTERPEDFVAGSDSDPVTGRELRELLHRLNLSDVVEVEKNGGALTRAQVLDCYEQLLDYLDVGGNVKKKNVLYLKARGDAWLTNRGTLSPAGELPELMPFGSYSCYVMDDRVLGIVEQTDKTLTLKDVTVLAVADGNLRFQYREESYEIACMEAVNLDEGDLCTLRIREQMLKEITDITVRTSAFKDGNVKVLLLNQGKIFRDNIYLQCNGSYKVKKNGKTSSCKKSKLVSTESLKLKKGKSVTITPKDNEKQLFLTDENGTVISNGYYGSMTIYKEKDGYYIVNKVKIEKYLYSVVASEMPASFGKEALKAQAVCARSYVYRQMEAEDYKDYHAQIDDSTNYQVYNKSEVFEADIEAVKATEGQVMYAGDEIALAYYFSTSCGYSSGMEIWNRAGEYPYLQAKELSARGKEDFDLSKEEAFIAFISTTQDNAYDKASRYYRWTARLEPSGQLEQLRQKIASRRAINPDNITYVNAKGKETDSLKGFGGVTKISCTKRSKSGAVLQLTIGFEYGKVHVRSEYNIRSILGVALEKITYQDGSESSQSSFVPSAYFSVKFDKKSKRYILTGGGNGHGMGMSQYGADAMAREGSKYTEILSFFYNGIAVRTVGQ